MKETKSKIRKEVLEKLARYRKEEREEISNTLCQKVIASLEFIQAKTIAITLAHKLEWDTSLIIEEVWKQGKQVCIPKTYPQGKMDFYIYDKETKLEKSAFGIDEPKDSKLVTKEEIDLIIVPGVVFDKEGYRIGFGGGYYDRYLADYQGKTIALASKEQIVENVYREDHDVAVNRVIIEKD
ncbi:MAG: 5-formyltetrahydrofolate cyclo-ligase [Gemella sp.]|nr:5-formyltetrahydrofolate cyclo-ligase [Gemella sp.]